MKTIRGNTGKYLITFGRKDHFKQDREGKQHEGKDWLGMTILLEKK